MMVARFQAANIKMTSRLPLQETYCPFNNKKTDDCFKSLIVTHTHIYILKNSI
jgi:hypothetical protein